MIHLIEQIERLKKLNTLIEQEKTGTPDELAERMGMSRSKLYELFNEVKSLGIKVKYDRSNCTFYYVDDNRLDINFSIQLLNGEGLKKINGGFKFFPSVLFSGRNENSLDLSFS